MRSLHRCRTSTTRSSGATAVMRRSSTRRSARCWRASPRARAAPGVRRRQAVQRLCEPERQIIFRVPWAGRRGEVQINRGFRVEFNSALGPYKGGLRFHPSVYLGIVKFLGFEQIFKNALTGMPIGGGKGGSDFDPQGPLRRRGHAVLPVVHDRAVPPPRRVHRRAGRRHRRRRPRDRLPVRPVQADHQPLRVRRPHRQGRCPGAVPLVRTEATGYGTVFFAEEMLRSRGESFDGQRVVVSGSGNVAIYAIEKAQQLGGTSSPAPTPAATSSTRTASTSRCCKQIKEVERGRITDYAEPARRRRALRRRRQRLGRRLPRRPAVRHAERARRRGRRSARRRTAAWPSPRARTCPTTPDAVALVPGRRASLFGPGKAANAGGVATSALEMQQNATRDSWTFEHTESARARSWRASTTAAPRPPRSTAPPATTSLGANIAGFLQRGRRDARPRRHLTVLDLRAPARRGPPLRAPGAARCSDNDVRPVQTGRS